MTDKQTRLMVYARAYETWCCCCCCHVDETALVTQLIFYASPLKLGHKYINKSLRDRCTGQPEQTSALFSYVSALTDVRFDW